MRRHARVHGHVSVGRRGVLYLETRESEQCVTMMDKVRATRVVMVFYVRHRTKDDVLRAGGEGEEAGASCSIHWEAEEAWELANSSNDYPAAVVLLPGTKKKKNNREAPSCVPWEASWISWAVAAAAACDRAWVDREEEAVDYGDGDDDGTEAVVHRKEEVRGGRESTGPRRDPYDSSRP